MTFLEQVQKWWQTDADKRDYSAGAVLMLQITNNKIQYNNVLRQLNRKKNVIEWEISKWLKDAVKTEEHTVVVGMRSKVDAINAADNLDGKKYAKTKARGKRSDHDSLPDEIKALYTENLSLLQSMREDHLQLRKLALDKTVTCLDAEQYPFLKDIIEKDERMHRNWKEYDEYSSASAAQSKMEKESKEESLRVFRQLTMALGHYKRKPTEGKKEQILELFKKVLNPSDELIQKMKDLGVYETNG